MTVTLTETFLASTLKTNGSWADAQVEQIVTAKINFSRRMVALHSNMAEGCRMGGRVISNERTPHYPDCNTGPRVGTSVSPVAGKAIARVGSRHRRGCRFQSSCIRRGRGTYR